MKKYLVFAIALTASACGSKSTQVAGTSIPSTTAQLAASCASSPDLGTWNETGTSENLVIRADCTGYSSRCNSAFTFATVQPGSVQLVAQSSNGLPGCPHGGTQVCSYDNSVANRLTINCTGTPMLFTK